MTSKTEEKWRINRQKNEFARSIPCRVSPNDAFQVVHKFFLPSAKAVEVCIYENHTFSVSKPDAFEDAQLVIECIELIRPHIEPWYPDFYKTYDNWVALDKEATKKARLEKILGAIANNLAEIPELKDEIIKLGKMLENGEDIRPYCGLQ